MKNKLDRFSVEQIEIIYGNSNSRFSGVTSTMLQVLPHVQKEMGVAVLGKHHLPDDVKRLSFLEAIRFLFQALPGGRWRLFHARRNDEMIQALVLKHVFRSKIKIVFTSTAQRKKSWLTRLLMRQMDGLISTCKAAADYMPEPPDVIVPHGISQSFADFNLNELKSPLSLPAKFNIGLFGRVRSQKGVDLLVDAALELLPKYSDWGLVIVGEITPEQKSFHERLMSKLNVAGLGTRVLFTNKLPFEMVPAYFGAVDIVCALSTNEGFGLTVLEGLINSKPVVATKAGAWPDILEKAESGFLIDVGDLPALCGSLQRLMDDNSLRERLGDAGRQVVLQHYTVEREAAQLMDYYRTVLTK